LHHIGKLLFAQATKLMNPTMNWGLLPSFVTSDPLLNCLHRRIGVPSESCFDAHSVSGNCTIKRSSKWDNLLWIWYWLNTMLANRMIRAAVSSDSVIAKHFMQAKGPGVIALSGLPC